MNGLRHSSQTLANPVLSRRSLDVLIHVCFSPGQPNAAWTYAHSFLKSNCPLLACLFLDSLHERREGEGVSAVLDAEHAQQEAVHEEQHTNPSQHGNALRLSVCHSGNLDCEVDSREGKDTIYSS